MALITLQSNDGQKFLVERKIAEKSKMIREMLEHTEDEEGQEIVAPLSEVNGEILKIIVEWIKHSDAQASEDKKEEPEKKPELSQWDEDFLKKINQPVLYDLILAANYMEIKGLLDLTCRSVARIIQGKSAEEIRKHFGIQNDLEEE